MTTAAPPVDIEMSPFAALYEGAIGNWASCGPVANEVACAALDKRMPDIGNVQKIIARDSAAGRFTNGSGQSLGDIYWDLQQRGFKPAVMTMINYSNSPNLDALHNLLKEGGLNKWPVIFQVSKAYNLPDNEGGVNYHFVVSGGINSTFGYRIANGDTRTGIADSKYHSFPGAFALPLNWATWTQIAAAGICGAILVRPQDWQPPAPSEPAPTTLTISLAEYQALQESAVAFSNALTIATAASGKLNAGIDALQPK